MADNDRWKSPVLALGYDAAAEQIHPHYVELQEQILRLLPFAADDEFLLVDLGGGSGRLVERFLERFPKASAAVIDQSEPFLELARKRLERFGDRARTLSSRLQDDWAAALATLPSAIVSMSAIHHLEPHEKVALYRRCHEALSPRGVLMNGDEVRDADETAYFGHVKSWAGRMRYLSENQIVSPGMAEALYKWEDRNVNRINEPRTSGDDCHEPIEDQLSYLREVGFAKADCPWHRDLWAILRGQK